ncbi:adenylate/guanylate cyclase domain-containing protein [Bradyrhizobium sp. NAS96.2]|uniref:adenylate/guanylate cyclase domain-containing protein n=1 Tax=Bradyrhizobium sp. NAS96.2 TaxID=1680160 RepID=UPI00093D7B2E|nr:adenylate/guanylate cyclase domain-containing protein [Bradyrhizobium sp. NAS96.2]
MTAERIQRRLAAVLAADVAGYSRLMGADEVGTLAALKSHRRDVIDPAIATHGGRIVKTTGDGILVEFASAVSAVTCAMAVQSEMIERNARAPLKIVFRMGINVGDIIVDGDDIFGDGVNVAARVENECEPGGVYLSDDAFRQVRGKTPFFFQDVGERTLKNIARPIRIHAVRMREDEAGPDVSIPAAAAGLRSILLDPSRPPLLPNKPSIAILPFQNMSGDPEQDYFADGMVEDITTALSRFKSLLVIARNSSFAYKGKTFDIKQVGRELGVRYVLEGSVRRAGGVVRITGQLIEAETGAHLWANRFDGALENVFDLQDSVARSVASAIFPQLISADANQAARKSPDTWDGYDHYLRGLALVRQRTLEGNRQAQAEFEKAMSLDSTFAPAYVQAAFCVHNRFWGYLVPFTEAERTEAIRRAVYALQLAPDHDSVLGISAYIIGNMNRELERGLALADQSLDLNPNLAQAWAIKGYLSALAGDLVVARHALDQATRLNPVDSGNVIGVLRGYLTASWVMESRDDCVAWAKKLISLYPEDVHALFTLNDAAILAGDASEAKRLLGRITELYPKLSKPFLRDMYLRYRKPEHQSVVEAAINRSGLPD